MKTLIGPFTQILTLAGLPLKGALRDDDLQIILQGGVIVENGLIMAVGAFEILHKQNPGVDIREIEEDNVLLPGFIECHTHMCYAGNRAKDYAARIQGKTYQEIAKAGGGIWDSVIQTRVAKDEELIRLLHERAQGHLNQGITTMEVKSGYGWNIEGELKMLKTIVGVAAKTGMN